MSTSVDILRKVTTATITTMLLKKGIRHCWIKGSMPLVEGGERLVGPAFTLRFVPVREDLATPESWGKPISTRAAIEALDNGQLPNPFITGGGYNCRHSWLAVESQELRDLANTGRKAPEFATA